MNIFATNLSFHQLQVVYNATKFNHVTDMQLGDFSDFFDGLILDRGTPTPPAEFVLLAKKGTHGGGHEHSFYINKKKATAENVIELLKGSDSGVLTILGPKKIQIKSPRLGVWIGKGGVWAKALKSVGIEVDYVELEGVSGWDYLGDLKKYLPQPLLTSGPGGTVGYYYFDKAVVKEARLKFKQES